MSESDVAEAKLRVMRRRRLVAMLSLFPAGLAVASVLSHWLQARFNMTPSDAWWASGAVTGVPIAMLLGKLETWFWPRDRGAAKQLVHHQREMIQRGRMREAVLTVLMLVGALVSCVGPMLLSDTGRPYIGASRWLLAIFAMLFVPEIFGIQFGKTIRSAMNDELTRFLRARALSVGYAVVLVAAVLIYIGNMYWQEAASLGLPVLLFLGVAVPKVCFAVFERRAGEFE